MDAAQHSDAGEAAGHAAALERARRKTASPSAASPSPPPRPYIVIVFAQLAVSWSSDRRNERWRHTFVPMFWGSS